MLKKNKKMLGLLMTVACLTNATAFSKGGGDNGAGNGGSVVVCFNTAATKQHVQDVLRDNLTHPENANDPFSAEVLAEISSIELLDLFYAKMPNLSGTQYELVSRALNRDELIKDREAILKKKAEIFYKGTYQDVVTSLLPMDKFQTVNGAVIRINDEDSKIIPNDKCVAAQIAVQSFIQRSNQKRVDIDARLFNKMDVVNQAALIFHERLYGIALQRGQQDSSAVRQIVGMIFDEKFSEKSAQAAVTKLFTYGFSDTGVAGIMSGWHKQNGFQEDVIVQWNMNYNDGGFVLDDVTLHDLKGNPVVSFYAGQSVGLSGPREDQRNTIDVQSGVVNINGVSLPVKSISFDRLSLNLSEDVNWNGIIVAKEQPVFLFNTSATMPYELFANEKFTREGIEVPKKSWVYFDEKGAIYEIYAPSETPVHFGGYSCKTVKRDIMAKENVYSCTDVPVEEIKLNNALFTAKNVSIGLDKNGKIISLAANTKINVNLGAKDVATLSSTASTTIVNGSVLLKGDYSGYIPATDTHTWQCNSTAAQISAIHFNNGALERCDAGYVARHGFSYELALMKFQDLKLIQALKHTNDGHLGRLGKHCKNDLKNTLIWKNDGADAYCE